MDQPTAALDASHAFSGLNAVVPHQFVCKDFSPSDRKPSSACRGLRHPSLPRRLPAAHPRFWVIARTARCRSGSASPSVRVKPLPDGAPFASRAWRHGAKQLNLEATRAQNPFLLTASREQQPTARDVPLDNAGTWEQSVFCRELASFPDETTFLEPPGGTRCRLNRAKDALVSRRRGGLGRFVFSGSTHVEKRSGRRVPPIRSTLGLRP